MGAPGRIIFDLSSIASWSGPPVGISRVQNALATYALTALPDVVLSVFDKATSSLRAVNPEWARQLVGWESTLETRHFEYRRDARRLRNWLPSRYRVLMALEGVRLRSNSTLVRRGVDAAQRLVLLSRQMPAPFADRAGRRLAVVPARLALGKPLSMGPRDVVVVTGSDWYQLDETAIGKMKARLGFRLVVMCYDIIPLLFPQFYTADDVAVFRRYWDATLRLADRIVVNSRRVEADVKAYCNNELGCERETSVVPLGYDWRRGMRARAFSGKVDAGAPEDDAGITQEDATNGENATRIESTPLPAGLQPDRFALFVSTIEPRKGHGMLIRVWRRLLAAGVPQRHRFKLVFVGRRGWKVDAVLDQIDTPSGLEGSLVHLADVSEGELATLYRDAAFCVYPSRYEGFGLPIIEAFSYGKAVIASNGGALPETVGGLSPCLDPGDEEGWFTALKGWIEDPGARASYEAAIRRSFSHPDWSEAAARFFDVVRSECATAGS
jgi:glycosyltransferase involved in cell wall biosynthesis